MEITEKSLWLGWMAGVGQRAVAEAAQRQWMRVLALWLLLVFGRLLDDWLVEVDAVDEWLVCT